MEQEGPGDIAGNHAVDTVPFHSISRSRVTRTFGFTKGNACHAVTGKMSKWFWG